MTSLCARLYGQSSAAHRAARAIEAVTVDVVDGRGPSVGGESVELSALGLPRGSELGRRPAPANKASCAPTGPLRVRQTYRVTLRLSGRFVSRGFVGVEARTDPVVTTASINWPPTQNAAAGMWTKSTSDQMSSPHHIVVLGQPRPPLPEERNATGSAFSNRAYPASRCSAAVHLAEKPCQVHLLDREQQRKQDVVLSRHVGGKERVDRLGPLRLVRAPPRRRLSSRHRSGQEASGDIGRHPRQQGAPSLRLCGASRRLSGDGSRCPPVRPRPSCTLSCRL